VLKLSPSEKKGILVISGILLISFIIQWSKPHIVKNDLYDYRKSDSIFIALSKDTSTVDTPVSIKYQQPVIEKKVKRKAPTKPALKSIDINTAQQTELEKLPRIGPATAKNIIEYRKEHGYFKKLKDIQKVKRIGPKTLEQIRPFIFIKDSL
jgi:comEA protein